MYIKAILVHQAYFKMVLTKSVFLVFVIGYSQTEAVKTLPNFVNPCKVNGPELSECYKENIEKLRPRLVEGIREFQILGLDPLHVTKLILSRNDSAALSYFVIFTNLIIEGGKDFIVKDLKVDLDNPSFKLDLQVPRVFMQADALPSGVILGFPMKQSGNFTAEINNVFMTYASQGKIITKKDNTYIDWNDGNLKIICDKIKFNAGGFFRDPNQIHLFNVAANENEELLRPHLAPALESFGAYITEALRRVHELFPLSVLYPEN